MSRLRVAVRRIAPGPLVRWVRRRRAGRPVDRPERPPRQPRHVFVVTYGRSGSTLVQGLLNALPRTLVRGENGLYVVPLFRAYADLNAFRHLHLRHNPRAGHSAFFGLNEIRPASLVRSTRQMLTNHMLGSVPADQVDVLGFKEVAWFRIAEDETEEFFAFFERVFPGCRYILNERDLDHVVGSGFWQGVDQDEVMASIRRVEAIQRFLRQSRPDRTLDLRYEDVTSDDPVVAEAQLRAIAEFVTGRVDASTLESMRTTMTTGHGPHPFGASRGRRERRNRSGAGDASG